MEKENMNNIDFEKVKDIVAIIIKQKGYYMGKDYGLTKKAIHKLGFAVRNRLSDKNPLKGYLPFYWYKFGPFSEVIEEGLRIGIREGIIEEEKIEDMTIFKVSESFDEKKLLSSLDIKELHQILDGIFFSPFKTEEFTLMIYKKAPRRFRYFAYLTKYHLDRYIKYLEIFKESDKKTKQIIISYLFRTEANLPKDKIFYEFNPLFSSFVTTLNRFLRYEKKLSLEEKINHIEELRKIFENMQEIFGEGERIVEHDPYYNNKIDIWKRQYYQHLYLHAPSIESLRKHIIDVIGKDNLSISYSQSHREMLSTIFFDY